MTKGGRQDTIDGAREIWLFDAQGRDLGFHSASQAQSLADDAGLGLVGPEGFGSPPRYRLADVEAYRAEQARAARIARSNTAPPKEIRLRVATGAADQETRLRSAASLLVAGHRVKLRVELDPRRRSDPAPARVILDALVTALHDTGKPEGKPYNEKGAVAVVLAPR